MYRVKVPEVLGFKKVYILFIFSYVIFSFVISVFEKNYSLLFFSSLFFLLCIIGTILIFNKSIIDKLYLFVLFVFVYFVYMVLTHYYEVADPNTDYFYALDQLRYYATSVDLEKLSISKIWVRCFTEFSYSEAPLFYALSGTFNSISNYFGTSSLLVQKLFITTLGAFSIVFINDILLNCGFSKKTSFFYSIIYGFFSFTMYFSVMFMRDIHVLFLYTVAIWVVLKKEMSLIQSFILILILATITFFLRKESGLFLLSFLGVLSYTRVKSKYLFIAVLLPLLVFVFVYFEGWQVFEIAQTTIEVYSLRVENLSSSGSLAVKLAKIPYVGRLAIFIFSQMQPFPLWLFWGMKDAAKGESLLTISESLSGVFWIYWWGFILKALFKRITFKKIKGSLLLLFILSISLIFLMTLGEFNTRRTMSVYPVLFVIGIYGYTDSTKLYRLKAGIFTFLALGFLHCFYIVIKYS